MKITLLLAGLVLSAVTASAQEIPGYLIEDKSSLSEQYYHYHKAKKHNHDRTLSERESAVVRRPYDVLNYNLFMDWVSPLSTTEVVGSARAYSGRNEILLKIDSANTTTIVLNAGKLRIDSVFLNGQKTTAFTQPKDEQFSIMLPAVAPVGSQVFTTIHYTYTGDTTSTGKINKGFYLYAKGTEVPNTKDKVEERIAYTMSEPSDARYWMPCNDQPDDKARAAITVRVPEGFQVSSNGLLVSEVHENGTATFEWCDTTQIATYLMVANASKFRIFRDWYRRVSNPEDTVDVLYYVWENDMDENNNTSKYDAPRAFRNMVPMMEYFSTRLTEYPFVKYGMTAVEPFSFGGMEHQTMTTVHRNWLLGQEGGIAHELMHQWTGDLVTCATWDDLWLNEGGATWGEALWAEAWGGMEGYRIIMNQKRSGYMNSGSFVREVPIYGAGKVVGLFGFALTYAKPAWVYHMLRTTLGDEVYFPALREYFNTFAFTSIETEDIVKFLEKKVPNPPVPFRTFFDQWIYQAGHPVYELEASSNFNPINGYTASVVLKQTQTSELGAIPEVFVMPVKITFKSNSGEEVTHTIFNNQRFQTAEFSLPFAPDTVLLDKDNEILSEKSVFVTATAIHDEPGVTKKDSYSIYPNPLKAGEAANIEYVVYNSKAVKIEIVNSIGQTIKVLKDGIVHPGKYPVQYQTNSLSSGMYSLRILSDSGIQNIPFVVVR